MSLLIEALIKEVRQRWAEKAETKITHPDHADHSDHADSGGWGDSSWDGPGHSDSWSDSGWPYKPNK